MLKSHLNINPSDVAEEEEEQLAVAVEEEAEKDLDIPATLILTNLSKSEVSMRLSFLGKTAENDGYAYLKATLTDLGLTHIDVIKCFKNLQFLDLSRNSLELNELQVVTELPYLILLQVDKNKLNSAALKKMPYLQVLIMNQNKITTVEDIFQPELSTLEIGFNDIKELNFKNKMPEIRCLDFRNNKISSIGNLDFINLDSLYLAYNSIKSLVGIEMLVNLRILHVRGNPIRILDGFHADLTKLTYINLRRCHVTTMIQIKKLRVLTALETLVVKGCPIMGAVGEDENEADAEEDNEIRVEILASLPRLKKLNKGIVTPEEREEAKTLMTQWLEDGEKDEEEIEPEGHGEEIEPEAAP